MSFLREDNIKSGGNDVITLIFLATIPVQTKVLQQDFLSWFLSINQELGGTLHFWLVRDFEVGKSDPSC